MRRGWVGIASFMLLLAGLVGCDRAYQYGYYVNSQSMYVDAPIFTVDLGSTLLDMEIFPYAGAIFEARELPIYPIYELVFNMGGDRSAWYAAHASRYREHVRADMQGELGEIFPTLDTYSMRAWIFFSADEFAQINVRQYDVRQNDFAILAGVERISDTRILTFYDDFDPEISYVHGVPVRVVMRPSGVGFGAMSRYCFQADFTMGSIIYRVRFFDTKDSGKERMTELVNKIIWGGTEGLHLLFDVTVQN